MSDIDFTKMQEELDAMAAKFGTTTAGLSDFLKVTSKSTKEFKKQIDELNKEIKKGKQGYVDQKRILDSINDKLEEFGDTTGDAAKTTKKQSLLAERDALAHSAMMRGVTEDVAAGVGKSVVAMTYGAGAFVKGLQANQSAAQLSGEVFKLGIDVAAVGMKTAGGMAEKFGDKMMNSANPWVAAIGLVTSGVGMLAQASAETAAKIAKFGVDVLQAEVEKTYKAFNSLSASGAMFADGMTGMRDAAGKAGMTVDLFAGVLKNQSANIAASGLGMTEGAKRIGGALSFGGDKMKKSLLNLGFGFEEQAELVAETMKDMRGVSSGPLKASNAQVAEQTQKYAENLRIITAITGEDAKKKMEETRNQANQLMFQQKLAGMDETQRKNIINAMGNMSKQQQVDYMDMINFGSIINTTGAVLSSTIPEYGKSIRDSVEATKNGTLDDVKQRQINASHYDTMNKQIIASTGTAAAGAAGLAGVASEDAKAKMELLNYNRSQTAEAIKAAEENKTAQEKTTDGLTTGVTGAENAAMGLKRTLQEVLTPAIEDYASVSQRMLKVVKDSLDEMGYGQTKEQKSKNKSNMKDLSKQYDKEYGGFGEMRLQNDLKAWNAQQAELKKLQELKNSGDEEEYAAMQARIDNRKKEQENLRAAGLAPAESGPSMVAQYMNGITKHAKGGSIKAGATGLVGEEGPELIQGPAAITPNLTTEQLIIAIDALREMKGTRTGENGFEPLVGMNKDRWKVLEDRIKPAKGTSLDALQKAFASSADYKPIGDAKAAMGFAKGGVSSGSMGGYQAELHGTEAVVPLPDGKSIPVKLDSSSLTASLQEQTGLLNNILTTLNKGNSLSSGILQNSY